MATSEVGPWAADKLERLGKYLHEYTKIMRKQTWCKGFYYIDAFAGPGSHSVRPRKSRRSRGQPLLDVASYAQEEPQVSDFLDGSPRVALDLEYPFTRYVFVEKNPKRVHDLEKLKAEYQGRRHIAIRETDCNGYLLDSVRNPRVDWQKHRAVVFLDPFGMQVPWGTLAAIGGTHAIEVFLNFPVGMAIQRLIPRNPDKLTGPRREMLDDYFGSGEWYKVVYRKRGATLLDIEDEVKIERSAIALVDWYRERLRKAFGHASKAALIRNTRGGHLYYLLLASPNATGVKIANHILSAGETI